jgi:hypothetical protein
MYQVRSSDQLLQHQGEGSAYIYHPFDPGVALHMLAANRADKIARERAIADRDEKLDAALKYNPKEIAAPYQQEQQAKYEQLLGQKAKLLQNHIYDPSHPERLTYEAMKNEMEQNAQRGKDAMAAYTTTSAAIAKDKYLKQEQAQSAANDLLHDETGTSRLPINQVNPEEFSKVPNQPQHFNLQSYGEDVAKAIPESVRSYLHQERLLGGERINEDIVKSKFHEYDNNGKLIKDQNGNPVVAVTPETKQIFYNQDPRAKAAVQYELARQNALPENQDKPLTEDDIVRQHLSPYAYSNINRNIGTLNKPNEGSSSTENGSNPASKFVVAPAVIKQKSASGLEHTNPGVEISHKDKPIDFQIAPTKIFDLSGGKIDSNKDRINFKASSLGYGLQTNKSKKLMAFKSVDDMQNFIETAPKAELDKYSLKQFLFGNIAEKESIEGDTEGAGQANDISALLNKSKGNEVRNRTVAVEYTPDGEAAARLRILSGGTFNKNRPLTEEEKKVVDPWNFRMNEKQEDPLGIKEPIKINKKDPAGIL